MSEEEYKIELFVKKRLCKGKTEYLVKSNGKDPDNCSWKPVANLDWDEILEDSEEYVQSLLSKMSLKVKNDYILKWSGMEDPQDNAWKPVVAHLDYKRLIEEYEKTGAGDFDKMKIKIDKIMAEQIDVVGSVSLYEKIHKTFLDSRFELFFVKEQFELYRWREKFFHTNFPFPVQVGNNWYTDGGDDTHGFDTLPFNITQHFDRVLMLACITKDPLRKVWFGNDEEYANIARSLYDSSFVEFNEEFFYTESLENERLSYSEAAHLIVTAYQTGPFKLEHLAMKTVLEHQIPLDAVPTELQVKAVKGMFDGKEDMPEYISDQGKEALTDLRIEFGLTDDN